MKNYVLYCSDNCPACEKAKEHLTKRNIKFVLMNITRSQTAREKAEKIGIMSVPALTNNDEVVIMGYSPKKYMELK